MKKKIILEIDADEYDKAICLHCGSNNVVEFDSGFRMGINNFLDVFESNSIYGKSATGIRCLDCDNESIDFEMAFFNFINELNKRK